MLLNSHKLCAFRVYHVRIAAAIIASLITCKTSAENQTVQFTQRPTNIGDLLIQDVRVELNFATIITQSDQVAHQSTNSMVRRQERGIEVLEVAIGRVRRAKVAYRTSQQKMQTGSAEAKMSSQPVEGKSYLVTRNGEQLVITDLDGNIPPQDQYTIVSENMQTLGKPNPLAKYLLGRKFTVGQRIALPQQLAEQLLGLGDPFGKVQSFELELLGTETIDRQPCALFGVNVEAIAHDPGKMNLKIEGRMAIQLATCRTVTAELSGPIGMAAEEKTAQGSYQYSAEGRMKLDIHSTYSR